MCGIAGIYRLSRKPFVGMDALASALLEEIQTRGRDATGFVAMDDSGAVHLQKASCSAWYFNKYRSRISEDARSVLLHTRFATQGKAAFPENNHPVVAGGIYCVHNGHIWNDDEIFRRHSIARRGQVDSEAIPALVASEGWASMPFRLADLEGDLAVAMVNEKAPRELVLARGASSPLVYVQTEHLLVWASTAEALLNAWHDTLGTPPALRRFEVMQEGTALIVRNGKLEAVEWTPTPGWTRYRATNVYRSPLPLPSAWKASEDEDDRVPLPLRSVVEEEDGGVECLRCEDCGDWYDTADLKTVDFMGLASLLCPDCAKWAQRYCVT